MHKLSQWATLHMPKKNIDGVIPNVFSMFLYMEIDKVVDRNISPRGKAKGIKINKGKVV